MPMRSLGEIFEKQQKLIKIPDKVQNLKENDCSGLRWWLALAHSNLKWQLPEGVPPFKPDPGQKHGTTPSNLYRELRTFYIFIEGGHTNLTQLRREQLFQQLLERLNPIEVDLLIALKDGKFINKYRVPKNVVDQAFPGLLEQPVSLTFLK